ncbi:indole-3-glycerol phosphate synthase TrpC [Cytobacillus sp. S13-E01]|uniref:indole-3-glycerol phosphate synthase TrpC n=1 Tax=Cytobacillus sp. S13-E01 TaxID=3031326 RepID=UPI0023D897B9|nr:indole-3-glycerol phosphate synthase TrpC [Cytobacillus sp. S13-E01]MDF0726229.1 indole-3-glycerol phosphate synthase TrpC [Cytobacillus sp. S13-E01]
MLGKIIQSKYKEVKEIVLPDFLEVKRKSLYEALINPNRNIGLIAEIKKASPSKGVIREEFYPLEIAKEYENVGVDAISVLTDKEYFQGSIDYLKQVKSEVDVPVLRKDFIVDPIQIEESVRIGADAILLIGEVLSISQLYEFYLEAYELGLECLVEVHSYDALEKVLAKFEPQIIGVNNRDLKTFATSIQHTNEIAHHIPVDSLLVSESGIHTNNDLRKVQEYGANAVLVGEAFMKAEKPSEGIKQMFGEDRHDRITT